MTALPAKTTISDTYPNPSNAVARAGFAVLWDVINEIIQSPEIELAAAATCDIGGQTTTKLKIWGTTTITSFGTNYRGPIFMRFGAALTITQNSSTLHCPGAVNLAISPDDVVMAWPVSWANTGAHDGWQVVRLVKGDGGITALTKAVDTNTIDVATTAFVLAQAGSATPLADASAAVVGTSTRFARADHVHPSVALGVGQTYQNVTASRSVGGGPYTNSTGKSIVIAVSCLINAADAYLNITVNGSTVGFSTQTYASGKAAIIPGFLIPPGATYSVATSAGTASSLTWIELS
jgi:uncharacterized protein YjhX (UPF0386 family)